MIKKIALVIVIISSLIMTSEGKWFTSKSTTFGLGDEKFGLDFFSISRTIYENGNDEFFVGFGTSLFVATHVGIGWKRYYDIDTNKKLKPFSCISMFERAGNSMSETNSKPEDSCIGLSGGTSIILWDRKKNKRDLYLNIGAIATYDFRNEIMGYPFINIEFK
tara:strand:+ start:316 stop:804 length:489 start_codon:yes stop_codon:yes gene_type:complete